MAGEIIPDHAGIATTDIIDTVDRLLKDGVSAGHIVTALLLQAAAVVKFGDLCPHAAKAAFACIISDPVYRAMKPPIRESGSDADV